MSRNGRSTLKTTTDAEDRPWLKRRLTVQQEKFAHYYCGEAFGNGAKAAEMAGFKHPRQAAMKLLRDPRVVAVVEDHMRETAVMPAQEVLARITRIGRVSLRDVIDYDPEVEYNGGWYRVNLAKAAEAGIMDLIREIRMGPKGPEVKLEPRMPALELLARHHHLVDQHHHHFHDIDWSRVPTEVIDQVRQGKLKPSELPRMYFRGELEAPQAGVVWDVPGGFLGENQGGAQQAGGSPG